MDASSELQAGIGYQFQNPALLQQALTHPSLANQVRARIEDNQRLEFLGDAVLQFILTAALYEKFSTLDEGALTKARAQLANTKSLAALARKIDLGRHLHISRGEEGTGGRAKAGALADGFEALIGAIFLDGGLDAAREFVLRQFKDDFGEFESAPTLVNPKGELQELLQAKSPDPVHYRTESVSGPDHAREFEVSVSHRGAELGRGRGKSKKEAESNAAQAALDSIRQPKPDGDNSPT